MREAAGSRFGNASAPQRTKLNLLGIYQNVVAPLLVSAEPRYHCTTDDHKDAPSVRIEQDWLNEQSVHIGLGETGQTVVTDALYATGIMEVCLASPCDAAIQAWGITAGEPIVQAIDLEDWVYPVIVNDFRFADFMGYRYRCPVDVARKMYGRVVDSMGQDRDEQFNKEGDERLNRILRGGYGVDEFEEHVTLWKIYLPRHNLVCTLADDAIVKPDKNGNARPLWEQKWIGPPTGPFLFCRFGRVPGAALAKAPMMDLFELHMDANNVHRKANNTLRRLKEITLYARGDESDVEEIQKSSDGEFVGVRNPDHIKTVVTAGAAIQGLFTAASVYKDLFSFSGGNLELLGGRGAQSRTATQDKILNQNAGSGIAAMHGEVARLMSRAGENLLWYAHNHPELVMRSRYKPPGSKGVIRELHPNGSQVNAPQRDFPFSRIKLQVDSYSLRRKEPEERLAFVQGVLSLFTPLLPLLAQQGVALDANALVDVFAELGNAPELADLFTAAPPPGQDAQTGGHERTLPGQTDRTYTRNSNPQPDQPDQKVAEMSPQDFGGQAA